MSSPQIPFNFIPIEGHLIDALNLLKKEILLDLSAHHVGTVQSFNATLQTATVSINYPKTYFTLNAATGLYSPVQVTYPVLVDCPVICLGGGKTALTFPIAEGDECLVLFNDRDLDNWFQGGAGAACATPRLHSFSDAIILVGLRSMGNALTSYDAVRAVLRNGTTIVGVGPSLIKLANNSTTLNTLLAQLITDLKGLVTNVNSLVTQTALITVASFGSPPVNAAAITAISAQLTTTSGKLTTDANNIAGLLE